MTGLGPCPSCRSEDVRPLPTGKSILLFGTAGALGSGEVSCADCGERWALTKDDVRNPWRDPEPLRPEEPEINEAELDEKWAQWSDSANADEEPR